MLLATMLVGAQTKIAPEMKKGMKKTYLTQVTINAPSKQAATISCETIYEVTDETADGYTLDVYISEVKNDAKDADSRIYSMATEMLKGIHTRYTTDKDGKVQKILDAEDVKNRTNEMLDNILSNVPLPESTTASELRKQLTGNLSEESLLQSVQISISPLTLNGKTISTGMEDEYNTEQGIKMKRTYTVKDKNNIQTSAKIDMSSEEIKKMITGTLEQLMPNQLDNVMEMMGEMIKNLKIDASENTTYILQKDGWVKSITSESNYDSNGMSFKVNTKVTLK